MTRTLRPITLGFLLCLLAPGLPTAGRTIPAAPRRPAVVEPFPLQQVRLLPGPFHDAMLRLQKYLLDLDPDRLLHNFRVTADLPSSAKPLGGWEAPDVELRGHTVGHYLSGLALMYASTGDARFKERGDVMVAELAKVQEALARKGFNEGYLSAFPEEFIDRVDARQRVWAPYYTLHKIMAGLLDMYQLAGNRQALDVLVKNAGWVKFRMDRLTREQQQAMLMTEHGGMTEVLANLYGVTGNPDHLRLARAFDHHFVLDPLARREDRLDGLHANTQIPKIIGAAREYELSGETRYRDIATFFWDRVARHRSYANGGHSDDEAFFPVDEFSHHLGASASETCNTYNMLKLTRHLFSWAPSAGLMDFYERALFNHILASQDPETGMMIYYCPMPPGGFRTYSTPDASFWCCVGTGLENHGKYPDSIYFHDGSSLYVNLFVASELSWKEKGLTVRQETRFPEEETTRLALGAATPVRLALKVRYPSWAAGMSVRVNGKAIAIDATPGSYVTIEREWKDGDTVEARMPMRLRAEPMPDDPDVFAILYGPVLLAGNLGREGLEGAKRYGPSVPPLGRTKTPVIPAFVGDPARLLEGIVPVAGKPLTFTTRGVTRPADVTLIPLARAHDVRYVVYWNRYSETGWRQRQADLEAAEARRRALGPVVLDSVDTGDDRQETAHAFAHEKIGGAFFEGRRGRVADEGWFGYDLAVSPDAPMALSCTYRGGEGRRRVFDILVDGTKVATENLPYHPTEFLDVRYPVPEALTRGKSKVSVRFQPHPGAATALVFDVRMVRAGAK